MTCTYTYKGGEKKGKMCGRPVTATIRLIDNCNQAPPDLEIEYGCSLHKIPRPHYMPSGLYGLEEMLQEILDNV